MAGSWSSGVLNSYVSPRFMDFRTAVIPDFTDRFPEAPHWMVNFFLNSVLRARYKPGIQQAVLGYLRRSHHAFTAYHDARRQTLTFLEGHNPHNPKLRAYYDTVAAWEAFALQTSMALDLSRWINKGDGAFKKNDGSKEQRLYSMANQVKHVGKCIESGQCTEEDTLPLWLSNAGLESFGIRVTYSEAAEILADVATLADRLQDPLGLREPDNETSEVSEQGSA